MKVVVINLDRSKSRMENIKNQLDKLDINFSRFSAIDGKTIKNVNEQVTGACSSFLCNYGMIGCAMSHRAVLQNFVSDDDNDFMCVMEDDIIVNASIKDLFRDIAMIHAKTNFDILSLFCEGFCNLSSIQIDNYKISKPVFPLSTASYIVSKAGAIRILDKLNSKIQYHIDFMLALKYVFGKINYFVLLSPRMITINDKLQSTMGSESSSLILFCLDWCQCSKTAWLMRVPAFSINMQHTISVYQTFLCFLLICGILFRLPWLIGFCILELALLFISI